MKGARIQILAAVFVLWAGNSHVGRSRAAGIREFQDSWLLDREHMWSLLEESPATGQADLLILSSDKSVGGEVGQGRLFGLPELEQLHLGLRVGGGFLGKGFQFRGTWQVLGKGLYRQTNQQLEMIWGKKWVFGFRGQRELELMESLQVGSRFKTAFLISSWLQPSSGFSLRVDLFLDLATGTRTTPLTGRTPFAQLNCYLPLTAIIIQLDRRADDSPVAGLEIVWIAGSDLGLSLRVDPTTGTLGPGILYRRGHLLLTTSHLVHPDLGQTHQLSVGFRV